MGSLAKVAIAAAFSLSLATSASAASSLSNAGAYAGVLQDFGLPVPPETMSVHTVGQTFSVPVPAENILVDFSLTIGQPGDISTLPAGPIYVRAAIFEWNPAVPELGNFIWDNGSDVLVDVSNGDQTLSFGVGTTLDPLLEYVAFLTLGGNDPGDPNNQGNIGFAIVGDPSSLPGEGVFFFDDGTTALWFANNGFDARFTANFTGPDVAVPAPAALAIFGLGLAGLGLGLRRRQA
jgi:hypothetical protein